MRRRSEKHGKTKLTCHKLLEVKNKISTNCSQKIFSQKELNGATSSIYVESGQKNNEPNELDEREMEAQPHRSPFEAMHSPHPLSLAPASPMDGLCDESGGGSEL
jgi:hypothetical protein